LLTGGTAEDGAYLAESLLGRCHEVHGIKRQTSPFNSDRIDRPYQGPAEENVAFTLHHGDLTDATSIRARRTASQNSTHVGSP
jgi:GDPmannose 4,6-dehydratase